MIIEWRYFSQRFQRYFDDPIALENHLSLNPDDQVVEVSVDSTSSGVIPEIPSLTTYYIREGSVVHELTFSGSNLSVVDNSVSGGVTINYANEEDLDSLSGTLGTKVTGPGSSTDNAVTRFDGTSGKLLQNSTVLINDEGYMYIGDSGTFIPGYSLTIISTVPSGNGLFLKASDTFESTALHIEDADGTLQLLDLSAEGEMGLGTEAPEFTIDVQQTAGSGAGSINVLNQYFKAGRRIDSQVQVDITIGTNLIPIIAEINLDTSTEIQIGTDFTVNSNNITIANPGIYEVEWSICGQMNGSSTGNRRRCLQTELNRNSGTIVQATRGGGYTRTVNTGNTCQACGSYLIETTSANETVGLRTEDTSSQSSSSITFTVQGGYLRVKRVD